MYTKQILEGVNYLHNEGVIHRDIKAANILVDHDGTIKLTDFGTSKVIETEESLIQQNKSLKGTPYWMAPEVC
jgi:mitogen-activated protein kinase kinase kinase 2